LISVADNKTKAKEPTEDTSPRFNNHVRDCTRTVRSRYRRTELFKALHRGWLGRNWYILSSYKSRSLAETSKVTGGGTGLGLTTAAALASNGARVYITGRRLEPLQAAAQSAKPVGGKGEIIPIQADISTKEGILSEFVPCLCVKWNVLMLDDIQD
jgi:hypothetical protein